MRSTNATLLETLRSRIDLWKPEPPWAVAYSGGRDSGVLLWALAQIVPPGSLTAVHVDHGWRPRDERDAEARVVEAWCLRLGVPLVRFGPPAVAVRTEAAARVHRYACFRDHLSRGGGVLFLAHHADDQAETVLMRLLRGRSWQGLAGIPARRGPYLRPFLGLRAALLAETSRKEGIPFHGDSTNQDKNLTRNLLRHEVFPLLDRRFPRAVLALGDFARTWADLAPSGDPDPAWDRAGARWVVASPVWDRWSSPERQAQLLAVAQAVQPGVSLSRRFLETVTRDAPRGRAQGSGWSWERSSGRVSWGRVVHRPPMEYFIWAQEGRAYEAGDHSFSWSRHDPGTAGTLVVPGVDPDRPWIWRSAVPGMRFASADRSDWGKALRHRRLGALDPGACAMVVQDGLVRAVVDLRGPTLSWVGTSPEKLIKAGIFVTLGKRSDYERR